MSDDLVSRALDAARPNAAVPSFVSALLRELAEKDRVIAELRARLQSLGVDLGRCPIMLPNAHGTEQCGRRKGHEGKCCYERMY